ncbi:MAG: hypothetical protein NWQ00_02720, partial [Burkholderiaceae bacterium]|nr:hypothetical protein [Burkholderiaceae bacterium]
YTLLENAGLSLTRRRFYFLNLISDQAFSFALLNYSAVRVPIGVIVLPSNFARFYQSQDT